MDSTPARRTLLQFRTDLYDALDRRADALFDVADALLATGPVPSLVHLSLAAAHRRGWGSPYAALRKGEIDREALLWRLAQLPLAEGTPIYAVDASTWARCDAETSPARGFSYHPSRHSAGQPIVAGWSYQWIAQLSFAPDSWTAPLGVRRVAPGEHSHAVALAQLRAVLRRRAAAGATPLFVFDAGYDPVPVTLGLAALPAAILVRMRNDRCCFGEPRAKAAAGCGLGPPFRHGPTFDCKAPGTWPPSGEHQEDDAPYGAVRVRAWAGLHGRQPVAAGTVVLVEVGRLPGRSRTPQVLWLWWAGPGWRYSGAPTCAASTWSIPSGSSNRRATGPLRASAIPSRQTAGPCWCWRPIPNSAWRAPSSPAGASPGSAHSRAAG